MSIRGSLIVVREYADHSGITDVSLCATFDQVKFLERLTSGSGLLVHVYELMESDMPIVQTIEVNSEGMALKNVV